MDGSACSFPLALSQQMKNEKKEGKEGVTEAKCVTKSNPLPHSTACVFSMVSRAYNVCCLLHCIPSPTYWHISIGHPRRFRHFYPLCTESFCKAAEVQTTVIGRVVGGSVFWAMHIALHQLWGLKHPSQPPSGAEVPAHGDRGVTAVVGFWLREAQAAWLLHDVSSTLLPCNAPLLGNMGERPERNHYTGNVLFGSTNSCEEKRGQKTATEISSWLGCRQPCFCLQKYFYSPKRLECICVGFIIKTQQYVPK